MEKDKIKKQALNKKKVIIVLLNLSVLTLLLWYLTNQYSVIDYVDYESIEYAEVLVKASVLKQVGKDTITIIIITSLLLIINGLAYKNWVRSKRWVIEPILIFIITIGISSFYYYTMTSGLSERMEKTNILSTTP